MVYKVVMVYGADGIQVERQIMNVVKVTADENFVTFLGDDLLTLASFSNDGILYYELVSLG